MEVQLMEVTFRLQSDGLCPVNARDAQALLVPWCLSTSAPWRLGLDVGADTVGGGPGGQTAFTPHCSSYTLYLSTGYGGSHAF